jgi:hypothetical protein
MARFVKMCCGDKLLQYQLKKKFRAVARILLSLEKKEKPTLSSSKLTGSSPSG